MGNKGFLAIVAAVGFIALLTYGLIAKGGPSIAVGQEAPDASVARLSGEGEVSLADHQGQWILLNFWASWCEPCRDESPAIDDFADENKGAVEVIGVDSDDNRPDAMEFARETGISYELLHDAGSDLTDAYNVKGIPESFLIDPDGEIAYIYRGPVDAEILEQAFKPLIAGEA